MLNYVSEDLRTALVCDSFGELSTQDKAGVLFTTGDDVTYKNIKDNKRITQTISGYGCVFNYS